VIDDGVTVAPPPRGPLRSSAGAPATTRSNTIHEAPTSAASRCACFALSGWLSAAAVLSGIPKSVAPPPVRRSTTTNASPAVAGNLTPASAATAA
jgi:hypothetical protein